MPVWSKSATTNTRNITTYDVAERHYPTCSSNLI